MKFFRLVLLLGVLLSSVLYAEGRPASWAVPVPNPALKNLFQVEPDLFRCAQPEEAGWKEIKRLGIRTVLNLRSGHADNATTLVPSVTFLQVPMRAWNLREDRVLAALKVLVDGKNRPLLVHCQHGADRTGGVIAMYRIAVQGWSNEAAVKEMTWGGYGFHGVWKNIIEFVETADARKWRKDLGL